MTTHTVGTAEEHLAARAELLQAEKEHTRRNDELARQRRELPWVRIEKDYVFDTADGEATLADLFRGRSQLVVYHFMYGPDWTEGCPSCSGVADGFDETHLHLQHHDVAFTAVSRAPLDKLLAYRDRMGWSFPWASSAASDFNFDFNVSFTEESIANGTDLQLPRPRRMAGRPEEPPVRGPGHERLRARGRRRLPHVLRVLARRRRPLGHVAVAGPGAAGSERGRLLVVRAPRHLRRDLPVMLAHVGGVPVEECLFALVAAGGGLAAALRARTGHDAARRTSGTGTTRLRLRRR